MAKTKIKIQKYERSKQKKAWTLWYKERDEASHTVLQNMLWVIRESWKSSKAIALCMFLVIVGRTLESLCGSYTNKYVVELALGTSSRVTLAIITLMLIIGGRLFRSIANEAGGYDRYVASFRFKKVLHRRLMKKQMTMDYENNEKPSVNDNLKKAATANSWIISAANRNMEELMIALLGIVSYGSILSILSPIMLLIVAVPAIAGYYINKHKMLWVWGMAENWQSYERELDYITSAGMSYKRGKDVRLFRMENWLTDLFQRSLKKRLDWYEQQDAWERRWDILALTVQGLGNFAAYAYVIYLVLSGNIGVGSFVLYFNSIQNLSQAFRDWCDKYSGFQWFSNNINYMRDYCDMKDSTNRGVGVPLPEGECEIEFRNVTYTYAGAEEPTLQNLSFTLKKGEKLALVGLNGAGKTTIIKLLCGLYDPTEGEILLNGVNVKAFNREEYFTMFSTVFQDISFLPVTVAENITMQHKTDMDMEKLDQCLQKAGIYEKIQSLPQGLDSRMIRCVYEDAVEFSGGEMQKLALARALYKNAPVLLLDEPTAALDPIAEQEMYLQYAEFSKDKSSIFISHRLASTRFCDRILLIENGRIAEEGTHSELMQRSGKYAELFELQSSYYNKKEDEDFDA
ncbi:MAG: ABC transporter ATP-binding protein [Ruminococcus sp.]|nr:ABC transporter ATP-binding protein [Ruminococcus sp.]